MYCKLLIKTQLLVLTGLHIGGVSGFSAIGAVDRPIIRDTQSNNPIIPGSSLKGKLRTLLTRSLSGGTKNVPEKPAGDHIKIRRLFGSSEPVMPARLQFADARVANAEEFKAYGLTEIKFENTIDRLTCQANPRQIERVNAGVKFDVRIVYDVVEEAELYEDMELLSHAMKLLQLDYLGGHGTRGSGRVSFRNIELSVAYPEDADVSLDKLRPLFDQVEAYELLSI